MLFVVASHEIVLQKNFRYGNKIRLIRFVLASHEIQLQWNATVSAIVRSRINSFASVKRSFVLQGAIVYLFSVLRI